MSQQQLKFINFILYEFFVLVIQSLFCAKPSTLQAPVIDWLKSWIFILQPTNCKVNYGLQYQSIWKVRNAGGNAARSRRRQLFFSSGWFLGVCRLTRIGDHVWCGRWCGGAARCYTRWANALFDGYLFIHSLDYQVDVWSSGMDVQV